MPDSRLFYIHDPMCSWCYAFSASWVVLQKELPANIQIIYLLGGLAPETTEPMQVDLQNKIQQTWHRIEETVPGVKLNYDFWLLNTPFRSTYPACRAILAAKKQGNEFETKILQAIQVAYYQKAKNPSLQAVLQVCASEVGLDAVAFKKNLASADVESELQHEIQQARSMGVNSFPSLRLLHNGVQFSITVDYLNHLTMIDEITNIIETYHN
mgnify:CR=1 FL=1|tara:strand:+ start:804 stop:1439 length:636 start_codon:yes stop_codon:yes gene_type:complete